MIDFEKTIQINMLMDFYGVLLTNKQREYMQYYFNDDLSLQEIADMYQVSRNAIYDNIQRTIKQIETYETKLKLLERFNKRQEILNQIKTNYASNSELLVLIQNLEDLE